MFCRPVYPYLISALLWGAAVGALPASMPTGVGGLSKQQQEISQKRVEHKTWGGNEQSDLMSKTFPMQSWGKHFSSLGSKRAPISTDNARDKKMFKTQRKEYSVKSYELSDWNARIAELHEKAGISTDDRARKIADQQMYQMAHQGTVQRFNEMREELSLRDINRYQFRHNRPDGDVPVQTAASGE